MGEEAPSGAVHPLVSVITATYNYSAVLKYAIQSVLWQTFQDFEMWVIGDACADDSEAVVASFGDPRIHWVNLLENSGSQSIPNNEGINRAQGKYVAYLGHDDLWHPTHLQVLVEALESTGAAAAHSLLLMNMPEAPRHSIFGLSRSEESHPFIIVPPSCLMHLRSLVEETGLWKNYRELRIPPDVEFVGRIAQSGKRFIPVMELTVFKFPSAFRKNVYIDKPWHEQAAYAHRIQHEPDFRYNELMKAVREWTPLWQALELVYTPPTLEPGAYIESIRAYRGLAPQTPMEPIPLLEDINTLITANPAEDITPIEGRRYLYTERKLPQNGILLAEGWYEFERDAQGRSFRWVNTDAEIIVTELDRQARRLTMDVWLGYANGGQPVSVALVDESSAAVAQTLVTGDQQVAFPLPKQTGSVVYCLKVSGSQNNPLPDDPRILNIGVSNLRLEAVEKPQAVGGLRRVVWSAMDWLKR